jgi:hypothetical protein
MDASLYAFPQIITGASSPVLFGKFLACLALLAAFAFYGFRSFACAVICWLQGAMLRMMLRMGCPARFAAVRAPRLLSGRDKSSAFVFW